MARAVQEGKELDAAARAAAAAKADALKAVLAAQVAERAHKAAAERQEEMAYARVEQVWCAASHAYACMHTCMHTTTWLQVKPVGWLRALLRAGWRVHPPGSRHSCRVLTAVHMARARAPHLAAAALRRRT
jgi:hypothetical protein